MPDRTKLFLNIRSIALNILLLLLIFSLLTLALFFSGGAIALPLIGPLLLSFATPVPSILAAALLTGLAFIVIKVTQAFFSRFKKPELSSPVDEVPNQPINSRSVLSLTKNSLLGQDPTYCMTNPFFQHTVRAKPLKCIHALEKLVKIREYHYTHNLSKSPLIQLTTQEKEQLKIMQHNLEQNPKQLASFIKVAIQHIMRSPHGLSVAINLRGSVFPPLSATTPLDELNTVLSAFDNPSLTTHPYNRPSATVSNKLGLSCPFSNQAHVIPSASEGSPPTSTVPIYGGDPSPALRMTCVVTLN